jgi:hypothetical protein
MLLVSLLFLNLRLLGLLICSCKKEVYVKGLGNIELDYNIMNYKQILNCK